MLISEISAQQLHAALSDNQTVVLYATTNNATKDAAAVQATTNPAQQYIPGTHYFDFKHEVVDANSKLASTMPSAEVFEDKAQGFGINQDSDIVVYDNIGNFYASRVWFMFKVMGHTRIRVLAGGLNAWLGQGYATSSAIDTAKHKVAQRGNFIAKATQQYRFVQRDFIQKYVVDSNIRAKTKGESSKIEPSSSALNESTSEILLFDARSPGRFTGQEPEELDWLRSGHIPHSQNLHYRSLQQDDGAFLPIDTLKQIFESTRLGRPSADADAAQNSQKQLAFTCGSGVTACILAQAADALGYKPLYVYDGSWSDWGADASLPIAKGE